MNTKSEISPAFKHAEQSASVVQKKMGNPLLVRWHFFISNSISKGLAVGI